MFCTPTMTDNRSAAGTRPRPFKNDMPSIHWRRAALAGIAAGVIATVAQIAMWVVWSQPLPAILFRDARLTAAIVMGREVLSPAATFDGSIMLVATLIHFALSIAYGLTLSVCISRLSRPLSLLAGAAFGLFLYAINMYGFAFLFPWFAAARDWITAATHVVFGVVVVALYKAWPMRTARSTKPRSS
jgi:hypothetical protein